jgi:hypothetical protein
LASDRRPAVTLYGLFAIAAAGTFRTRPDISDTVRGFIAFLSVSAVLAGVATAFTSAC